jgi:transcription initiation factor TFIIE subunit alpha
MCLDRGEDLYSRVSILSVCINFLGLEEGAMRITPKIVDNVVSDIVGNDGTRLLKALKNKKNVSEFKLAESLKKEINTTRNMLYKLYDANLVSFTRKKDKEKGWYIYYWTFNGDKVHNLMNNIKKDKMEILNEQLKKEKGTQFYTCPSSCVRFDFENSTEHNYKCPECGSILEMEDNSSKVKQIEMDIKSLGR